MKTVRTLLALGAVCGFALAAPAGTMIDAFKAPSGGVTVTANAGTPSSTQNTTGSGIIGGTREANVTYATGGGNVDADINNLTAEAYSFSSQASTAGSSFLAYGSLRTGGSDMNADLSGDDYIRLSFYSGAGPDKTFTMTVTIDSGGSTASNNLIIPSESTVILFPYSLISPINLSDVDGIKLFFNNASNTQQDFTFSFIDSVVPEPATMLVVAAGAVAMLSRRRRR